jgi:hypothetical protein
MESERVFADAVSLYEILIYLKYILYKCDVYMVSAMIKISDKANQVLNIVKARNNLNDKSEAIEFVTLAYGTELLEENLRPEFVEKIKKRQKEKTVKVKDFRKHFGLD